MSLRTEPCNGVGNGPLLMHDLAGGLFGTASQLS